jgi:hypothetical protein
VVAVLGRGCTGSPIGEGDVIWVGCNVITMQDWEPAIWGSWQAVVVDSPCSNLKAAADWEGCVPLMRALACMEPNMPPLRM